MIELVNAGQLADKADAVNSWVGANTYQPVQINTPLYAAASTIDEPWITGSANMAQTGRPQVDRPRQVPPPATFS